VPKCQEELARQRKERQPRNASPIRSEPIHRVRPQAEFLGLSKISKAGDVVKLGFRLKNSGNAYRVPCGLLLVPYRTTMFIYLALVLRGLKRHSPDVDVLDPVELVELDRTPLSR
jgi:hypothetical protein